MQITEEYKNKVLQAFNRSRYETLSKGDFKVGDYIITGVPYKKVGNDYAFDLETLEVLQYCEATFSKKKIAQNCAIQISQNC